MMPGDKYEKYGRPIPPADRDQEYMTVQETAYVLGCSVSWMRRFLRKHPKLHSRQGRRIITDRAARAQIYRLNTGSRPPAKKTPATPTVTLRRRQGTAPELRGYPHD
jgi:hypothetical protein